MRTDVEAINREAQQVLDEILVELGREIAQSRYGKAEIEDRLGWDRGTIDRLLEGREGISLNQLGYILAALEVDMAAFFKDVFR